MDCKCKNCTHPNEYCACECNQHQKESHKLMAIDNYPNFITKKEKHQLIKLLLIALLDELETECEYERPMCNTCKQKEFNYTHQHESNQHMKEHKHCEESSSSSSSSTWQEKLKPSSKSKLAPLKEEPHSPILNEITPMKLLEQFDMAQLSELINLMSIGDKLNSLMGHQTNHQEMHVESSSSDDGQDYVESSSSDEDRKNQESSSGYRNLEPNHCSQHNHHDVESSSSEEKKKRDKKVNYENKSPQGKSRARKRRKFD